MYLATFQCAGCLQWIETTVDPSGGSRQTYVEDCQVCCKPNVLRVEWDKSAGEYTISAELERLDQITFRCSRSHKYRDPSLCSG